LGSIEGVGCSIGKPESSIRETEQKVGDKRIQIQYEKGDEVIKEK
jgi:hypothetical protein